MTQAERRLFLIRSLLKENAAYRDPQVPADADGQRQLLRSLMNVRAPETTSEAFLTVQDDYLRRYKTETGSGMKVIFNVFKDTDREIYERLLRKA